MYVYVAIFIFYLPLNLCEDANYVRAKICQLLR